MRITSVILGGTILATAVVSIGCSSAPKPATNATTPTASTVATASAPPIPTAQPGKQTLPEIKSKELIEAERAAAEKQTLTCKHSSEERQLEIQGVSPAGCELWYSKNGKRDKVAWSTRAKSHCETVQAKMKTNLETGGFKCGGSVAAAPPTTPVTDTKKVANEIKKDETKKQ